MASDQTFSDWYFAFSKGNNRTPSQEEIWKAAIASRAETSTPVAAAAQPPMFFASPEQASALQDRPDDSEGGVYLPLRKTAAGNFTMPLYCTPVAAVAQPMTLSEFCAEADRIGLTAQTLAKQLAARPEFANCLPSEQKAAQPVSEANNTSFLIQIVGEDIDHPLTAILPDWEAVRRFCVEHYVGREDHTTHWGELTLDVLKREFDEHEAEETGKPYSEAWEIGGLTIERVCDCTPPVVALRAQAAEGGQRQRSDAWIAVCSAIHEHWTGNVGVGASDAVGLIAMLAAEAKAYRAAGRPKAAEGDKSAAHAAGQEPDMRAICEALGFDPTNHHNAAKCPYCRPTEPVIVVQVKNEILGDSIFWRGPASQIGKIRNIPARETAHQVAKDGKPRANGMWHVRIESTSPDRGQP